MMDCLSARRIQALCHTEAVLSGKAGRLRPLSPTVELFRRMGRSDLLEASFAHVRGYQFDWGQLLEFSYAGRLSWEFCMDDALAVLLDDDWSLPDLILAMRGFMRDGTPNCLELSAGCHPATAMCLEVALDAEEKLARSWMARVFLPYLSRLTDAGVLPRLLKSAADASTRKETSGTAALPPSETATMR